jgi:hypothetical protein
MNVKYGIGKHLIDVPPAHRPIAMMWRWIGTYFYIVITALVKIIIGLFLLRICNHQRWERITLRTTIGVVAVYNLFFVFLAIFACRPVEYQWTGYNYPVPAKGECNNSGWATYPSYVAGFLNVAADWILPLLPARLVWKATMERRKKISVCAVLALGSMYVLDSPFFQPELQVTGPPAPSASIASIVRLPYAINVLDNPEYLYNSEPMCAWSTVEIGIGLTASSLATLTPLFRKIKVFKRTHLSGEDQGQETADNPSPFVHKGGAPADENDDMEALKHQPSAELRYQPSTEFRYQPSDSIKRQTSDEIELYRFR